ncbi:MAG: hypothetical protein HFH06_13515 [Lachnospiraceae bacterium]|nr:hypothetical protein [Lachnospiraceae bacterium]
MSDLIKDLKYFWSKKTFAVGLITIMILSYATLLFNPTVGIDDTSFKLYYIDGVSPAMGRWCLYMIHKLFPLDYNPYFVETIGLLFFCLSVSLWCVVFYRLFGSKLPVLVYTLFAGVMISSPILSEVVVWYVQDGIYLGYGVTALAVLAAMKSFTKVKRIRWKYILLSALLLAVSLGFYEAFIIVFLMGLVMNFMVIRTRQTIQEYDGAPSKWFLTILAVCGIGMIFRSLFINGIILLFRLEDQTQVLAGRGFGDIVSLFMGWFDGTRSIHEFLSMLKEFFVKYSIHGIVYLPVLILVLAELWLVFWGIRQTAATKDGWVLAAVAAILFLPWVMPILEGVPTYYRSSEYVPLLTAFAALLAGQTFCRKAHPKWLQGTALFLAFLLLYRQGYEMNKWLLIDAMKYEDDKRTLDALALELMAEYDTDKPICIAGSRQTPVSLLEDVYTPDWSKKYSLVKFFVCMVDEEIFDKYNTPYGYAVAETPQLSFINWANKAYYGFDRELIRFWEMHGFSFQEDNDTQHYKAAEELMRDAPVWPAKGSILEMEDYIIVNFGNY